MSLRTWRRMETHGQATIENLANAAIALRCEDKLGELFPAPAARNMDELLRQQRDETTPSQRRRAQPQSHTKIGEAVKRAPGVPLGLGLAFEAQQAPTPAGRLAFANGLAQLEWSREVVANDLAVAALNYPPEPGLHAARGRAFDGLHGVLADSLPERWGYILMRKRLAKLGHDIAALTPLERLALVGNRGRGALVFEPSTTPQDDIAAIDLDALAEEAAQILSGADGKLADTLAGFAGGSGGARPKVHVGFNEAGLVSIG